MKVQIGEHQFHLPTFRVGFLRYFSLGDLYQILRQEPPEVVRDWISEEYAENLALALIAPDAPKGSVYLASALPLDFPDEDCTVLDEEIFFEVAFVCSRHFNLLDNPALNAEALRGAISRNSAISAKILGVKAS